MLHKAQCFFRRPRLISQPSLLEWLAKELTNGTGKRDRALVTLFGNCRHPQEVIVNYHIPQGVFRNPTDPDRMGPNTS